MIKYKNTKQNKKIQVALFIIVSLFVLAFLVTPFSKVMADNSLSQPITNVSDNNIATAGLADQLFGEYVVGAGESMKDIAQNLYGDSSKWTRLVELNQDRYPSLVTMPNNIYSDWVLKYDLNINSLNLTSAEREAILEKPQEIAQPIPVVPLVPPVSPNQNNTNQFTSGYYEVQPGDDLKAIALKIYGDAEKWTRLVELNQDQFPSLYDGGANTIYSGWILKYDAQNSYDYELVSQSPYPAELNSGETANVWVELKNTGNQTWLADGSNPVRLGSGSAYGNSNQQLDYASEFVDSDWLSANRPVGMLDSIVQPGQSTKFQFNIKAPATPGIYKAYFTPVVDGINWMKDIGIYWEIKVK
ncbi:MAG: LysM peptidoglycan-binding domain-containing protein [Patescibacteria group bacterium]|nr:LysM peptidoglycan-binding domain-containing protein [Patescibacteria group bacterium]